ncbi:MAG: class I SAM-dependent methyltransferase [Candidatus Dormiibacterota bacterium]
MGTRRPGRRGDYGVDGSFGRVPAPLQAAGIVGAIAGAGVYGALSLARGRRVRGALASTAAAALFGVQACYLYTTRAGKFGVWAELLDGLGLRGGERVLDLGCGRGAVLNAAAARVPQGRAVGVDLWHADQSGNSPEATRRNARLEGVADLVDVLTADMTRLPFPDRSFDLVVSNLAIHNLPSAEGRRAAIEEAVRVLRAGGRLVLVDLWFTSQHAVRCRELGLSQVRRWDVGWRMWLGGPWFPAHAVAGRRAT